MYRCIECLDAVIGAAEHDLTRRCLREFCAPRISETVERLLSERLLEGLAVAEKIE